jgi:hypothetical protein
LKKELPKEILPRLRILQQREFFFTTGWHYVVAANIGLGPLAEEADQSLDVLGSCRQEELLPNKL